MLNWLKISRLINEIAENYESLLLFIGSPRTGSTLIGQIINYHPQCLIATEFRIDSKVIREGQPIDKAVKKMIKKAQSQFQTGLAHDKRFAKTIDRYQPKWIDFNKFRSSPVFEKKRIRVIGDKKAGGLTDTCLQKQDEFIEFAKNAKQLQLIHPLRDPIDSANSLLKSHYDKFFDFETACEYIINKHAAASFCLERLGKQFIRVYYEELLSDSRKVLTDVLKWMALDVNSEWLDLIVEGIAPPSIKEHSQKEKLFAATMINKYNVHDLFNRYV